eukprot:SRR837773.13824.p2 GENE.SRR837773.13824~~SRR837773.13824.p2  ORF type:complete len:217 (-),score=6.22 SRR837773.13824:258-827(-)
MVRFRLQASVMQHEGADVYCLQEVFSEAVVKLFEQELGEDYILVRGQPSWTRALARAGIYASIPVYTAAISYFCQTAAGSKLHAWFGYGVLHVAGETLGAVVLRLRPNTWWSRHPLRRCTVQVKDSKYRDFETQGGDWLNLVRARGFLATDLGCPWEGCAGRERAHQRISHLGPARCRTRSLREAGTAA